MQKNSILSIYFLKGGEQESMGCVPINIHTPNGNTSWAQTQVCSRIGLFVYTIYSIFSICVKFPNKLFVVLFSDCDIPSLVQYKYQIWQTRQLTPRLLFMGFNCLNCLAKIDVQNASDNEAPYQPMEPTKDIYGGHYRCERWSQVPLLLPSLHCWSIWAVLHVAYNAEVRTKICYYYYCYYYSAMPKR